MKNMQPSKRIKAKQTENGRSAKNRVSERQFVSGTELINKKERQEIAILSISPWFNGVLVEIK